MNQSFVPYTPDSLLGTPCYYYVTPLHRFNKRAGNILPEIFGPYRHDRITQLLQICQLHVHDENLIFHHIPKLVYWIEIWRLRRAIGAQRTVRHCSRHTTISWWKQTVTFKRYSFGTKGLKCA